MKEVAAIIVAGGKGTRMGSTIKKQYLKIGEKEVLAHTVEAFEKVQAIKEIIVVTSEEDTDYVGELLCRQYGYKKVTQIVAGGKERQYSVFNGIKAIGENIDYVLIHDGARPFIKEEVIIKSLEKAYEKKACIVAVPVKDTIKQVDVNGKVETTPNRASLWGIQTPQVFERSLIEKAHAYAKENSILGTDDSMLVEAIGEEVYIVEGDYTNIKITTPEDLIIAETFIK